MPDDVVEILEKGRQEVDRCDIEISGDRRQDPPRRFTAIRMQFRLVGKDLSRQRAERALELSRTTYCSVWSSLAQDTELDIALTIEDRG